MSLLRIALACLACVLLISPAQAQNKWGTLKGRIILDAEKAPEREPVQAALVNDPFCQTFMPILKEDMVVDKETKAFAGIAIYLNPGKGAKVDVHPNLAEALKAKPTIELDNKNCAFVPHVVAMHASQKLVIKNSDKVAHNSQIIPINPKNKGFNPQIPPDGSVEYSFQAEETLPVQVKCSSHTFMAAWILVRDNPYFAVTKEDGTFEITNLPVGKHKFRIKHADSKYVGEIAYKDKQEKIKAGNWELEIVEGDNDLGDIKVKLLAK